MAAWACLWAAWATAEDRHGCRYRDEYDTECVHDIAEHPRTVETRPSCPGKNICFDLPIEYEDRGSTYYHVTRFYRPSDCPPIEVEQKIPGVAPRYRWKLWRDNTLVASGFGTRTCYTPALTGLYRCEFVAQFPRPCPPPPVTCAVSRLVYESRVWGESSNVFVKGSSLYLQTDTPAPFTWHSSNTNIAEVRGWGSVYGVSTGQVVISTVDSNGCGASMTVKVLDMDLVPDFNHDLKIDATDKARRARKEAFRFWKNDDDDAGTDEGSDIPGAGTTDAADLKVDGVRDLVDWFPVQVDLKQVLDAYEPAKIKLSIHHLDGAKTLRFIFTDLSAPVAGRYLTDLVEANRAVSTPAVTIGNGGLILPATFLDSIRKNGTGIMLVEARQVSSQNLRLLVRTDYNGVLCARDLRINISAVEDMYRWINLRPSGGRPTSVGEPANNPDDLSNGKNVIFLHGFNVTAEEARGWNAEMFKRLYWSGSNAKFWGVAWQGDAGLVNALNYQENVAKALACAEPFNAHVRGIAGEKIALAHSLGNMVVSAAIQDYGLPISKYFMLNAAVATECYRPASFNEATAGNYMLNEDWVGYKSNTWCSTWFRLFSSPDDRAKLTWKGRFPSVVSVAYNFYSSGDEIFQVFSNGTPSAFTGGPFHLEQFAWQKQEHFKGRTVFGIPVIGGTDWAGWGFSGEYSMAEANAATPDNLRANAVFRQEPATMFSSNITAQVQNDIIAQGVPALSCAAGLNAINAISFYNYNVNDHKQNGWGRSGSPYYDRWLHSDLKSMAYMYTYEIFNQLVSQGGLQ